MLKPFLLFPMLAVLGASAFCQDTQSAPAAPPAARQAQFNIPAEYVSKANPVKPTAESQVRAKKMYGWDCAMCHGDNGVGNGDVDTEQKLTMLNYRDAASLKGMSDGEIFYIIKVGKGQMPS